MFLMTLPTQAQRIQQPLGRGVVAVYGTSNGSAAVTITWRRLAQEPEDATYNIYVAKTINGEYTQLNTSPLTNTNYKTTLAKVPYGSYIKVTTQNSSLSTTSEQAFHFTDHGLRNIFMEISYAKSPLVAANYDTKFVWPCDLNGNGEYDYIVDRNPTDGTENHFVEAYLADGTYLWTIDLGPNELSSSGQDDQICSYDIDCDGYGEVIVQTSDGTRFWDQANNTWGLYVGGRTTPDTDGDGIVNYNSHATINAPKYMTVVNGMTGAEKASVEQRYDDAYNRTNRATLMGDEYYRHTGHVGIFYHDGIHPGIVMEWHTRTKEGRHQYRNSAFAFDFDGNGKASNWHQLFMEHVGGAEFHMIRIFDADGDGCDEMSSGAYCMNNDGTTLYNTGISHGDRHRTADIDPERPGLETFSIQQNAPDMLGQILFDAGTGEAIKKWYLPAVGDVGRGECIDIDPTHLGWEMFSTMDNYQIFDAKGNKIEGMTGYFPTEGIWWDGELDRENVNSPDGNGYNAMIVDYKKGRLIEMAKESGWTIQSSNGKRGKYWGDIIGDWREELILNRVTNGVNTGIVGFTTDYTTTINNIYCLQQDPHYRMDCTTRGYYQTPCPAFYLGYDMPRPQLPPCMVANDTTDVFGIADGTTTVVPRKEVTTVYAMPVKNQVLTLNTSNSDNSLTIWKAQQGTTKLSAFNQQSHINKVVITEGTVELTEANSSESATLPSPINIDLRARGTLSGTGAIGSFTVEGALNYEGCRIMPTKTLTFTQGLNINKKTYAELNIDNGALIHVDGDLNVTAPLIFTIVTKDIQPGEYTLIEYSGSFAGTESMMSIRGLQGLSFNIVNKDNTIKLIINGQRDASDNVIWTGATSKTWDYQTENFTLGGNATEFVAGDGVVFDDSAASTSIIINDLMPISTATFANNSKSYVIGGNGGFSGTGDVIMNGTGRVTLNAVNSDYTGKTIINSGTVSVKELADAGIASSIGAAAANAENLQIGKATFIVNNTNSATNRGITLTDTATVQITSGVVSLKGIIKGKTLTKTGSGQLNITYSGANDWSETILQAGTLAMGAWNTTFGKATSQIHVTGNTTIVVFDQNTTSAIPTIQNTINIDEGKTLTLHAGSRCAIKGALKGKGTYKIDFPYVRGDVSTNVSAFEGIYEVASSNCRFIQAMDFSNATLKLDANSYAAGFKSGSGTETAYTHKIGTLTGTGTLGTGTWQIGRLLVNYKPSVTSVTCDAVTINGTATLNNTVIDMRATSTIFAIPDYAEMTIINGTGKRNVSGTITVLPERPKEGWRWDTSRLASDGVISIVPDLTGIDEVDSDALKSHSIYDLQGRKLNKATRGVNIINGKKVIK